MLKRRVRNLAVAAITIVFATMLTALSTAGASATTTADHADPFYLNYNSQAAGRTLCLGISGGDDDAPAVQWTCNGHPDQIWHLGLEWGNSAYYQLINNDDQCLGVAGGSIAQGARVVGWTCSTGAPNQYWSAGSASCGLYHPYYNLGTVLDGTDLVLGVSGNSLEAGASVVIWSFQDRCNNQYWEP